VTASIASTRAGVDDPRPLRFRLGPQPRHRVGRHLADLGHRLGGRELDVEPDRQPALGREDAGHLGAGVARDHGGGASCGRRVGVAAALLAVLARGGETAAAYPPASGALRR
jgi:hypothetical protein